MLMTQLRGCGQCMGYGQSRGSGQLRERGPWRMTCVASVTPRPLASQQHSVTRREGGRREGGRERDKREQEASF